MELREPRRLEPERTAIVREGTADFFPSPAADDFAQSLHILALQIRLAIGAHQSAISYIPHGNFQGGVHTHSFSEKYEKFGQYDVTPIGGGVLRMLTTRKLAIRMSHEELIAHPFWENFNNKRDTRGLEHPPMRGWLAAPVLRPNGDLLGILQLTDKFEDAEFTSADLDLLIHLTRMVFTTFELEFVYQQLATHAENLRLGEQRFHALVDASAEIVWATDASGANSQLSPSWQKFTGQNADEQRGSGWLDALHPEDRANIAHRWQQAVASRSTMKAEYRIRHVSGEWRWTSVRGVPLLNDDGSVRGWVGMNTDITERKRAEEQIRSLNADLEQRVRDRTSQLEATVEDLRNAMAEIKTLRGLIPICAWCKKIRDDAGYWQSLELFLQDHTDAKFSHGICPACYDQHAR